MPGTVRRFTTLLRQPPGRMRLAAAALLELARAWWLVRFRAFPAYAPGLGDPRPGEVRMETAADRHVLADVRWAVGAVNRTFGGRFTCLMQAMAAKRLLARRGVASALVLGARLARDGDKREDSPAMGAHAWLWAGGTIIVGAEGNSAFAPVASYV